MEIMTSMHNFKASAVLISLRILSLFHNTNRESHVKHMTNVSMAMFKGFEILSGNT